MSLYDYLQKKVRGVDGVSAFIKWLYSLLANSIFQGIINACFAITFALVMKVFNVSDGWIITIIVLFIIFTLIFGFLNKYRISNYRTSHWFRYSLNGQTSINSYMANKVYDFSTKINSKIAPKIFCGFQAAAYAACESIYNIIHNVTGCENQEITVFQQYEDDGKCCSKMIAFGTSQRRLPSSIDTIYPLFQEADTKKPLHTRIFEERTGKTVVLLNQNEIKDEFVINNVSREREEKICQYIGIPALLQDGTIGFILQIDVNEEEFLGKNKEEMIKLAEETFNPYVQFLRLCYEHERLLETYYGQLHMHEKRGGLI